MQKITAEICAKCLRRKLKNFSGKKNISVIECVVSEIPTGPGKLRTGYMRPVRKKEPGWRDILEFKKENITKHHRE